jgi:hypothetical protein
MTSRSILLMTALGLGLSFAGCSANRQTLGTEGDQCDQPTAKRSYEADREQTASPAQTSRQTQRPSRPWWARGRAHRSRSDVRTIDVHKVTDTCQNCGHDLRGNKSGVCPACGASFLVKPDDETANKDRD